MAHHGRYLLVGRSVSRLHPTVRMSASSPNEVLCATGPRAMLKPWTLPCQYKIETRDSVEET